MMTGVMFSGQGAQQVGMGKSLYDHCEVARARYNEADEVLGWPISRLSFEGPEEELVQTRVCQPALFVHGYVAFELLRDRGLLENVKACLGLSLGEITALTAAGAFDFATGLRVVAERGRRMQEACESTEGGMASVLGASREEVQSLCSEFDIDLANINCPGQIVVSGERDKVVAAVAAGRERGLKRIIPLRVAGAYHSRLMEPARRAFAAFLETVTVREPACTVITNTTGKPVATPDEIREALIAQVVSPVLWEDCQQHAASLGIETFYECGPGGVLAGLARRTLRGTRVVSVAEYSDLPGDEA